MSGERKQDDAKKWDSDFLELMEHTKNPNYGRFNCFHCLLSPDGDDPIFIGINRLVARGLSYGNQEKPIEYPCQVVNRFQCPYEKTTINDDNVEALKSRFNVEDLFKLQGMAFVVEIALAKARKEDSKIQIRNKQDLHKALTEKETFRMIIEQGEETLKESEDLRKYAGLDREYIIDYFMKMRDKVDIEKLRFY
jgi:hypothetical protein